jgi:hypothetical protein
MFLGCADACEPSWEQALRGMNAFEKRYRFSIEKNGGRGRNVSFQVRRNETSFITKGVLEKIPLLVVG